jgi:hypothetical protein
MPFKPAYFSAFVSLYLSKCRPVKQRFHLQGLAYQKAFFFIKPADFSAFVNLYLFKTSTFPPSRFSLSKSLFSSNQLIFCFCEPGQCVPIDNIVLYNAVTSNVSTFKV